MKEQRTDKWYEVKIQYQRTTAKGSTKKESVTFCIAAQSFTEAETRASEETIDLTEVRIVGITPAKYKEVFLDSESGKFFKVRVMLIDIDDRTGKEKAKTIIHLVQADSTEQAEKRTREVYNQCIIKYVITDINETRIGDVIIR